MGIRERTEAGFERWGHFVTQHRWSVIGVVLIFSAALISQIPRIRLDASTEGFLHPDDPILQAYDEFRDEFARDDLLLIAIGPTEVFDLDFLSRLKAFHRDLEAQVPQLDDIGSLLNARSTRGEANQLIVEDLLEDWPRNEAELRGVERRARANPVYRNLFLSEDARYTAILLKLPTYSSDGDELDLSAFEEYEFHEPALVPRRRYLSGSENAAILAAVRAVIARHQGDDFQIHIAGAPVLEERIAGGIQADLRRFLGLAILASCAFLFILFRRASGVLLPVTVVLLSLLTTVGLMPLFDMPLQVATQMIPALLMSVGLSDSVHILVIFFQRLRNGDARAEALAFALGHTGLAVVLTSLTTAGALLSFTTAELAPVSNLGVLGPIGVMLAMLYSVTLLPALLAVVPLREVHARERAGLPVLDRLLSGFADVACRHPWKVVLAWSAILVAGVAGSANLRFSHNPLVWFNESDELRIATEIINRELKGVMTLDVLFETGSENGLYDPDLLGRMDDLGRYNADLRHGDVFVGKTLSVADILKEIHQALHENRAEFRVVPQDRRLVAQELLLFENTGSDDLEDVVDSQFRTGRMTLKVPWVDAVIFPSFIERIEQHYRTVVGEDVEITVTGRLALLARTFVAVIESMARSYVFSFLVITPLMILLLASIRRGLLAMIPNVTPILLTLGLMGVFDVPLDTFTLLVGSVVIGLAVDDTIHFMHNFQRYHGETGDARFAVSETIRTTGQAMLFTTLVLCTGFFIFMLGSMRSTFNFGFLTGFALLVAFLADVLLSPALMILVTGGTERARSHDAKGAFEAEGGPG